MATKPRTTTTTAEAGKYNDKASAPIYRILPDDKGGKLDVGTSFKISNVRIPQRASQTYATFNLAFAGISLYNMRAVNGKNGMFISPPQTQGQDGKWYNQFGLYLSEEYQDDILDCVIHEVDKLNNG